MARSKRCTSSSHCDGCWFFDAISSGFHHVLAADLADCLAERLRTGAVREAPQQLREEILGLPARRPLEALSRRPRLEHVNRTSEDVEHLAGDWLRRVGAEGD